MTRNYLDVLQNIEFVLLSEYENDVSIDDEIVAEALRAAILNTEPDDDIVQFLKERLEGIRQVRSDVSDDIWRDGLRTVLQSVMRHSSMKSGCTLYLDFVSDAVF
jgi:phosphosulfolactate phosphohydrolase-like enzyme